MTAIKIDKDGRHLLIRGAKMQSRTRTVRPKTLSA